MPLKRTNCKALLPNRMRRRPSGVRVAGDVVPLFEEFDGNILYFADIAPITLDFGRVLSQAKSDPRELLQLSPRQFEELIADIWKRFGYDVELTAQTRDGGRDIVAIKQAEANLRVLIECKRYDRRRKVGVGIVRELYGVKVDEGASKAILATTSTFSLDAKDFFAKHLWELEPRDYDGIVDWIGLAIQRGSM
jgi:hypothetical protein